MALKNCAHCSAYQSIDYKIAEDTIIQPDLSVLCKSTTKKYLDFAPSLVVEILSPSTALKDRHTKAALYAGQSVPYYIIVSPDTEEVEVYVLEEKEYSLKQKGKAFSFAFTFTGGCEATIDFTDIWS